MRSDSLQNKIMALGIIRKYKQNALLFQAHEVASGFFYVLKGEVRVFKMDENGREVEVVRLEPGDFLAGLLGTISATLSRNLREMQQEGLIDVRGKRIWIQECSKIRPQFSS